MYNLNVASVEEVINILKPDIPILCISKTQLEHAAKIFITEFPGKTLYAIKCNPHPIVISNLANVGIMDFDTASLEEIKLIKSLIPKANCYFNHPIKTQKAIHDAYHEFNVRDFVVDHINELDKIHNVIGNKNIIIQFRIAVDSGSSAYNFNHKFGISMNEIQNFIPIIKERNLTWALSFHVGSQCENPSAYGTALGLCKEIINQVSSQPQYINVGGGFPGYYSGRNIPNINQYFGIIKDMKNKLSLPSLFCEPGRAMVCNAGSLIVRIVGRKSNKLYINDGVYGSLGEVDYAKLTPKVQCVSESKKLSNQYEDFTIFGPTCDSFDVLEYKFSLPKNIDSGDWIIIPEFGAYSTSLSSRFNGFSSDTVYLIN